MLENSFLLEGLEAKEIDKLLQEYNDVTTKLKDLETTKKSILARVFEIANVGVNETSKFTFNICEQAGKKSISVNDLMKQAPDLFGKISSLGLVSVGKSFKTLKSVKVKGNRI